MIVAAPKIVGTNAIADIYQVSEYWVRRLIRNKDPRFLTGHIRKVGQRHCWNLHEALAGLYNPDELIPIGNLCAAPLLHGLHRIHRTVPHPPGLVVRRVPDH